MNLSPERLQALPRFFDCIQTFMPSSPELPPPRSAREPGSGRMVRAMNLAVTVEARLALQIPVVGSRRQLRAIVQPARVELRRMARLAEVRYFQFQHAQVVGTVRIVTVRTVLPHRAMLEQHGAALVGVAGITGLVDGRLLQQARSRPAMRVVATGTGHLAFPQRHVRRA